MEFQSRWWHLAAVQVGGVVCLPIFVLGHAMAAKFGLMSALAAVGIGNLLILLFGMATAVYAAKTRLTTAESAEDAFGEYGKPFFAFVLIISMMGWFAVQLDMMGTVAGSLMGLKVTKPLNVVLGGLITLFSLRGMKGMELLANICLPLLLLTVGYAVFAVSDKQIQVASNETLVFGGVSIALAAAMGAVIDLPTFFRGAKNGKEALIAAVILFGIAVPLLEGIGIYLAVHGASDNLVSSLANENSPLLWKGWVALFIILAGWTTNSTNLYSAITSLKAVVKLKESSCHLLLGALGTGLSLLSIQENLFVFLECIGILLGAGGGVMILNQLTLGKTIRPLNMAGLILGIAAGFLSLMGFAITDSGFIDAFCVAIVTALIGTTIYKKREFYETN